MHTLKLVSLPALSAMALPLYAQDETGITPYRSSLSNPAQLPLAGQRGFEAGGLTSSSGDSRRARLPYTFKLAFNEQWSVLIGGEAYDELSGKSSEDSLEFGNGSRESSWQFGSL